MVVSNFSSQDFQSAKEIAQVDPEEDQPSQVCSRIPISVALLHEDLKPRKQAYFRYEHRPKLSWSSRKRHWHNDTRYSMLQTGGMVHWLARSSGTESRKVRSFDSPVSLILDFERISTSRQYQM